MTSINKILDWTTQFDQAANTMTHIFSEQVSVQVDFGQKTITLIKNGSPVSRFIFDDDHTMDRHYLFLHRVAKSAAELDTITSLT